MDYIMQEIQLLIEFLTVQKKTYARWLKSCPPGGLNRCLRRHMYEEIGIDEWTNMIYTYDSADSIDMREIEAIIRTKILPRIQGR